MIPDSWYTDDDDKITMPVDPYRHGLTMFQAWQQQVQAYGIEQVLMRTGWRLNQVGCAEMQYPTEMVDAWFAGAVKVLAPIMVMSNQTYNKPAVPATFKGVGICGSVWFDYTIEAANVSKKTRVSLVAICDEKRELQRIDILLDPTFDETWV